MNAKMLALMLLYRTPPANPIEVARGFVAAMPEWNGVRAVPDFDVDEAMLAEPRSEAFEASNGLGLRNDGVVELWTSVLDYLADPPGCIFGLTCGFHPDVATVWPYLRAVAEATTLALRPAAATLGGLAFTANPVRSIADVAVPRVFAPWMYVALRGLPAPLASALRALPAEDVREHGAGLVIEAVRDPFRQPDPAFVKAVEALPLTPKASYRHLRFPTHEHPV